jgi:cytochrome c551/c552
MIKVLVAGLLGTVAGVVVMIIVIVAAGTRTSGASTVGLGQLSTPTASLTGTSTPPPASSGGSSTPTSSGGGQGDAANGKTIFTGSGGCGSCHALSAAGTSGAVGPNLDSLSADAQKAGMPLDAFIKESIVNPGAYIAQGYSDGIMPATFGSTLSASDIADLVALISSSQK